MDKENPFKEFSKMLVEDVKKYGTITEGGDLVLDDRIKGPIKIGEVRKEKNKEKGYKEIKKDKKTIESKRYKSSYIDEDKKIIVEQVWDKENGSRFCVYDEVTNEIIYMDNISINGITYYPQEGEEIEKGAILLPSFAQEYGDDLKLDEDILSFTHKWLDVPEEIEQFGLWNTKRSWVYEKFHTLNYLRFLGDTGVGKTRSLDTYGHIHFKPIFTTGSTTPAPLFRIIDKWKGTLVMDEADLRKSDESEQIIKILNQGFEKGKFIMRCDQIDANKLSFFDPYCPKIITTRRTFEDKATESRCITHVCSVTERKDIPLNLNEDFKKSALDLRNKLLMWRFRNYFKINKEIKINLEGLEPRVKQIVSSYIALFSHNKEGMERFKKYIKEYQGDLIEERQTSFDGSIVGAIYSLIEKGKNQFTTGDIIKEGDFVGSNGKPLQPRFLTSHLKSLGFKKSQPTKVNGFTKRIIPLDKDHLRKLFIRYGYEVTEVTVLTVTSEKIKKGEINEKLDKVTVGGANHMQRNLRNSVTDTDFSDSGIKEVLNE